MIKHQTVACQELNTKLLMTNPVMVVPHDLQLLGKEEIVGEFPSSLVYIFTIF
jgi:hypothetical protein